MMRKILGSFCLISVSLLGAEEFNLPPYPCCEEGPTFIMNADYLYWFAREDGLDLGLQSITGVTGAVATARTKPLYLNFEWSSGFQVGLGTNFANSSRWKIYANWTWFQSDAKYSDSWSIEELDGKSISPNWFPFTIGATANGVHAHWDLHYNVVDLDLRKVYLPSCDIRLEPLVGARGVFTDEHFRFSYDAFHTFSDNGLQRIASPNQTKMHYQFQGVGLHSGVNAEWFFLKHLAFIGNVSGALVFGEMKNKAISDGGIISSLNNIEPAVISTRTHFHDQYWTMRPNIDLLAGFQYQKCFDCRPTRLTARIAYQMSYWFEQNPLIVDITANDSAEVPGGNQHVADTYRFPVHVHGDLNLQGLVLSFSLDI